MSDGIGPDHDAGWHHKCSAREPKRTDVPSPLRTVHVVEPPCVCGLSTEASRPMPAS
jgi:hypothetical protein